MMNPSIKNYLNQLTEKIGADSLQTSYQSINGGCINETFKIVNNSKQFFLKVNSATEFPGLFDKEKNGLELFISKNIIRVPKVILCEQIDGQQILLLEWIEEGLKTKTFWRMFGEQLANLHQE